MKKTLVLLFLLTCFAGAKTVQTALQSQTTMDGVIDMRPDNTVKMTFVGSTAKILFDKIAESRITSIQPTEECIKVIIKSGDNIDCGRCIEKPKQKNAPGYWCTVNFDGQFGKVLLNPMFAPVAGK